MKNLISLVLTALSIAATVAAWLYNSVIAVTFMKVMVCIGIPFGLLVFAVLALMAMLKPQEAGETLVNELKWWLWPLQAAANLNHLAQFAYFCALGSTGWAVLSLTGLMLSLGSVYLIYWMKREYQNKVKKVMANTLKQAMAIDQQRYDAAKHSSVTP